MMYMIIMLCVLVEIFIDVCRCGDQIYTRITNIVSILLVTGYVLYVTVHSVLIFLSSFTYCTTQKHYTIDRVFDVPNFVGRRCDGRDDMRSALCVTMRTQGNCCEPAHRHIGVSARSVNGTGTGQTDEQTDERGVTDDC